MTKILLVDDDENLRPALAKLLQSSGFQVECAEDGEAGFKAYVNGEFDLVLSDIQMPRINGIQLLKMLKGSGSTPVILITGFSELLETAEAYRLGASGFLPKPFKKEELLRMVEKCLKGEPGPKQSEEDFCRLNLEDFITGRQLQYDIYFRISDKFIKVAHEGDDLPRDRIDQYKKKGLRFLYMRQADFARYVGMSLRLLEAARSNATISLERRMKLLRHTGEILSQKFFREGIGRENFEYAKTYIDNILAVLSRTESGLDLLEALGKHSDHLYGHSLGVSMISVLIAKKMEWVTVSNLTKVAMGGMLHDVGMKELDSSLTEKLRVNYSSDEIKEFESHASRGMEIIGELKGLPGDVLDIVVQHHEDCLGQGYPRRLKRRGIHPMARLVAVADEFCYLTLGGPGCPELSPGEAIQRLHSTSTQRLDGDFLGGLMKVFQVEKPAAC